METAAISALEDTSRRIAYSTDRRSTRGLGRLTPDSSSRLVSSFREVSIADSPLAVSEAELLKTSHIGRASIQVAITSVPWTMWAAGHSSRRGSTNEWNSMPPLEWTTYL